jgi:hypothetical protein
MTNFVTAKYDTNGIRIIDPTANTQQLVGSYDANSNLTGIVNPRNNKYSISLLNIARTSYNRVPMINDNSSVGFAQNSIWQALGKVYAQNSTYIDANSASWEESQVFGAGTTDILGSTNTIANWSFFLENTAYAGNLVQLYTQVGGVDVFTDIPLRGDRADPRAIAKVFASADVGAKVRISIGYDQSGNANHFTRPTATFTPVTVAGSTTMVLPAPVGNGIWDNGASTLISSMFLSNTGGTGTIPAGTKILSVSAGYSNVVGGTVTLSAAVTISASTVTAYGYGPEVIWDEAMQSYVALSILVESGGTGTRTGVLQSPTGSNVAGFRLTGNNHAVIMYGRPTGTMGAFSLYGIGDGSTPYAKTATGTAGVFSESKYITINSGGTFGLSASRATQFPETTYTSSKLSSVPSVLIVNNNAVTTAYFNEDTASNGGALNNDAKVYAGFIMGANSPYTTYGGGFRMTGFAISNIALTTAQILKVKQNAYARYNIIPQVRPNIFLVGDSRIEGLQRALPIGGSQGQSGDSIGCELANIIGNSTYNIYNCGHGGQGSVAMTTTLAPQVVSKYSSIASNTVFLLSPINDFLINNMTVANSLSVFKTLITTLKQGNAKVIVLIGLSTNTTTNNTNVNYPLLESAIVSAGESGMGCDEIIDMRTALALQASSDATMFVDGIHEGAVCGHVIAGYIRNSNNLSL